MLFIVSFFCSIVFLWLIFTMSESCCSFTALRYGFVKALIWLAGIVWLFTEILSLVNAISFRYVSLAWTSLAVFLAGIFFYCCRKMPEFWQLPPVVLARHYVVLALVTFSLVFVPLFFSALYYPPNTGDAMVHHLPRIEQWVQNENVDHFPAEDIRQLYHQPFAEFMLLHLRILTNSDVLFNLLQFFAMLGVAVLVSLFAVLFGFSYQYQFLAGLLPLLISMGVVQATSTQTDYVAAFFLLAFIFFCWHGFWQKCNQSVFLAALALGLGILTKLSVGIFALPFGIWFGILYCKRYGPKIVGIGALCAALIIGVNVPFYVRNFTMTGDVLGSQALVDMMKNKTMNVPYFLSNVVRNIAIHCYLPIPAFNRLINKFVYAFHRHILHIDTNEEDITFSDIKFKAHFLMDEGSANNFLLLLLLVMTIFYIVAQGRYFWAYQSWVVWYLLSLVSGFVLFCGIFKWQPWHARLQLPLFVAALPLVLYCLHDLWARKNQHLKFVFRTASLGIFALFVLSFLVGENQVHQRMFFFFCLIIVLFLLLFKRRVFNDFMPFGFSCLCIIASLPYVYCNTLKPLLLNKPVFMNKREANYFTALSISENCYEQYRQGVELLQQYGITNVALDLGRYAGSYPLVAMIKSHNASTQAKPLVFIDECRSTRNFKKFSYQAIVSDGPRPLDYCAQDNIVVYTKFGNSAKYPNVSVIILKHEQELA